ncbi:PAS domain S-box-containing protein/diguanylate cyclase (GGDEF)-like protein [Plasticicumulans lactativorans]|uniref:PAS domain S-box-containing protein/diguanylate cyclase (GGDEF)-like protein n=1 Tax=Plasticicumulans lactativorans TaxID=1133106 RepID=A0A4R2LJK7_9GAMM|nr:sensor domain-containing diguanylate cyclase [Plasticicumulans lactativorans]TCO79555.1 PAS domain S-box-containing protein/diguanylate cyclase (GGDEF)-like protein [Plasticicumulans lactativorans]
MSPSPPVNPCPRHPALLALSLSGVLLATAGGATYTQLVRDSPFTHDCERRALSAGERRGFAVTAVVAGLGMLVMAGAIAQLGRAARRRTRRLEALRDALAHAEERWRFALQGADDGVWDWHVQTGEEYHSERWRAMLGYAEGEIADLAVEWEQRIHPDDREQVLADLHAHLAGRVPAYRSEHRVRCRDGAYKWILDRGVVIDRDAEGRPLRMVGTHVDISAARELQQRLHAQAEELRAANARLAEGERRLHEIANTDALTGVLNRRALLERARSEVERARRYHHPLAALVLDLDHFKRINDTHGHAAGDAVLRAVVGACTAALRTPDVFGRTGGEEFVALLPETDTAAAIEVAERLRVQVRALAIEIEPGVHAGTTMSIGVAMLETTDTDVDRLLARADRALYRVKHGGRDAVALYTDAAEDPS